MKYSKQDLLRTTTSALRVLSDRHSFTSAQVMPTNKGNIKHEKYSKITLNISTDYKVTDNFKVGFQFNGARILPRRYKKCGNSPPRSSGGPCIQCRIRLVHHPARLPESADEQPYGGCGLESQYHPCGKLPRIGQCIRSMGLPEKLPVQSNVFHGLCFQQQPGHTRLLSTYSTAAWKATS